MMTLRQFSAEPSTIFTIASWYLADLSKAQEENRVRSSFLTEFNEEDPNGLKN